MQYKDGHPFNCLLSQHNLGKSASER